jgi:TetR/AcrR family transcriptional regulator, transcriptional repressor of bet genes
MPGAIGRESTRGTALPKLGMGPIRREQICRATAVVIAREGFAGSTMRMVAEEAGVSTGMLNHYFANRKDLLTQALVYVSERTQERMRHAIEDVPPGRERLIALLDSALADEDQVTETWRVWINVYGEAVRLPELRHTIEVRLHGWYELIDRALEGLVPPDAAKPIPWSWRLDAVLNGLAIQALTSEADLDGRQIRDEVIRTLFPAARRAPTGHSSERPAPELSRAAP